MTDSIAEPAAYQQIVHSLVVFADLGSPGGQPTVIAEDVKGELRSREPDSDYVDIVVPADFGALGSELMVSLHVGDLVRFVRDLEQHDRGR
jgi:hypothetical protein